MRVRISVHSSNIEANKAQIISLLKLSLFHISATSKSYISELSTAVLEKIMLPNHSKGLTCLANVLASVLVLVNASISVAAMEGFLGLRKAL